MISFLQRKTSGKTSGFFSFYSPLLNKKFLYPNAKVGSNFLKLFYF
nr:MAG TPA: hypothetical protein [Bacteriophage sp.]